MVITFVPCVAIWIQEFCIQSAFSVFCCKWSLIPINIPLNNSVFFHNLNRFGNVDCKEIFVHYYWVCSHAFPVVCGLTDIFQLYFTGNRKIVASPLTALQVKAWMSGYIKRETKTMGCNYLFMCDLRVLFKEAVLFKYATVFCMLWSFWRLPRYIAMIDYFPSLLPLTFIHLRSELIENLDMFLY